LNIRSIEDIANLMSYTKKYKEIWSYFVYFLLFRYWRIIKR